MHQMKLFCFQMPRIFITYDVRIRVLLDEFILISIVVLMHPFRVHATHIYKQTICHMCRVSRPLSVSEDIEF